MVKDISGGMSDRFIGLALGLARGILVSMIVFTSVLIITSKSYETSNNIFELITPKESSEKPRWMSHSSFNKDLQSILNQFVEIIGEKTLKHIDISKKKSADIASELLLLKQKN